MLKLTSLHQYKVGDIVTVKSKKECLLADRYTKTPGFVSFMTRYCNRRAIIVRIINNEPSFTWYKLKFNDVTSDYSFCSGYFKKDPILLKIE